VTAVPVEVRIGQVWQDNDKRGYGRRVRIVEIVNRHIPGRPSMGTGTPHAVVELVTGRGVGYGQAKPGRRTTIRLDRFKPTATGYRLVSEPEGER
jgi:hypothetical protein